MDISHYHYSGGCAVQISHIINTDEGMRYRTAKIAQGVFGGFIYLGKMIFYRQSYYNINFITPWLCPDILEVP